MNIEKETRLVMEHARFKLLRYVTSDGIVEVEGKIRRKDGTYVVNNDVWESRAIFVADEWLEDFIASLHLIMKESKK